MSEERARRYNKNKLAYNLLPTKPLADIASVYTLGAHKYTLYKNEAGEVIKGSDIKLHETAGLEIVESGSDNWRKGMPWMEMYASILRHLEAWKDGEDIDLDLGTPHLSNAGWGILGLLEYSRTHPNLDDRKHRYLDAKKIGLDLDGVCADFTGHLMAVSDNLGHIPKHWNDPIVQREFELHKNDPEFWLNIPTLFDPSELHFEPHCYITARPIDSAITQMWLDKNGFPTAPLYCVGSNESKVQVAINSGIEIFIDDNFQNFVDLNKAGIFTYLYDAPYNKKYRVGNRRLFNLTDLDY